MGPPCREPHTGGYENNRLVANDVCGFRTRRVACYQFGGTVVASIRFVPLRP